MVKKKQVDWFLFVIATGLAIFGSVMVYSASAMISLKETQDQSQYTYFYKQLGFTLVGIGIMFAVSRLDYHFFDNKYVIYGLIAITVLLLLLVFGFPKVNGARRWIRIAGLSFQPSELTKVVLPLFLAWFLTKKEQTVGEIKSTLLPCLAALIVLGGLVFAGPDLGTAIVLCAIFSAIYFAAGAKVMHIAAVGGAMAVVGLAALALAPWRVERIMAFLDPYKHSDDAGYQVVQSLYAIGSGGILGEGFAKGQQKLFYLPYPYSDFIFSVVGEELGLIGTLAVVAAFGLLLWRGTRAAMLAPDRFGMLLAIGITTGIVVQALFNISVVISILPAKGIPLPFISYGGSSVLVTLFAVGLLLSISRKAGETVSEKSEESASMYRRKGKTRFA
jgi:cell division protein FtsW